MTDLSTILARHSPTLFASRDEAEYCADCNNRDADGWSYRVRCVQHDPRRYIVVAYDDDGQFVGAL
jgi:hypothetical protein